MSPVVTSPASELVRAVVAMAPARLLRLLCDAATAGESPAVSVHLSGGQVLDGTLISVGADHGSDVVVLAAAQGGRLGYALLAHVIAVEVHNPALFQDVITAGRLALPSDGERVTRLALQREFGPTARFPVQVDWAVLGDSGPLLTNLSRLLRGLREAAAQVQADQMGRQAWEQVHALRVEHRNGSQLSVRRTPEGLSVCVDLAAALPRALAGELHRQISALL